MTELKDRFQELLDENGLTSNKLATAIEKSPSTLSRIKTGDSQSTKTTIELVANYFGVNPNWLATGLGEKYEVNNLTSGGSDNSNVKSNLVKADLIQKLDVIHFKGNIFIKTPFNKYLLLVPVLGEMAQEELLLNPNKHVPIDDYNRHPMLVSSPISGNFLGFEIIPDYSLNRLLAWDIIEKDALVVGREIKRALWDGNFYFHNHKLYVIIHKRRGILIREVLNQPQESKLLVKTYVKCDKFIEEEIDLGECVRIYSVVSVCHNL